MRNTDLWAQYARYNTLANQRLYTAAAAKMNDAAAAGGLATRAEQNTSAMLTSLLKGVGYTDITVRFYGDAPVGPVAVTTVAPSPEA